MDKKKLLRKILIPVIAIIVVLGGFILVSNKDKTTETKPNVEEINGENTEEKDNQVDNQTPTEEENGEQTEEKIDTSTSKYVDEKDLPTWTNCNISFGKTDIQLPLSYANFKKLTGYHFAELDEDGVFPAEEYDNSTLLVDDENHMIMVSLVNRSRDELSLQECTITSITIMTDMTQFNNENRNYPVDYLTPTEITFPENIKLGDNVDEVEEKLGESFDSVSNTEGTYFSEYWSINDIYTFSVAFQDGKCVSMSISTKSL